MPSLHWTFPLADRAREKLTPTVSMHSVWVSDFEFWSVTSLHCKLILQVNVIQGRKGGLWVMITSRYICRLNAISTLIHNYLNREVRLRNFKATFICFKLPAQAISWQNVKVQLREILINLRWVPSAWVYTHTIEYIRRITERRTTSTNTRCTFTVLNLKTTPTWTPFSQRNALISSLKAHLKTGAWIFVWRMAFGS